MSIYESKDKSLIKQQSKFLANILNKYLNLENIFAGKSAKIKEN